MNISILQLLEGAQKARGLTVVIDVFRAFSLEAYMFAKGVERIIPVADIEEAYALKRENPEYILAGERGGRRMPGFDLGNSPAGLMSLDVKGRTVVHTTSAGTQGVANASGADEILVCSLVNARATAEYIRSADPEDVSLVCMGLAAKEETEEDTLCARYIRSILEGRYLDVRKEADGLRYTSGRKFFDERQADVFPRGDFDLCIDADRFGFVMKVENGEVHCFMMGYA